MLAKLGKRAWLHCDDCRHGIMIEPRELAQRHQLDMLTPLLAISKAMRCTRCGAAAGRNLMTRAVLSCSDHRDGPATLPGVDGAWHVRAVKSC